jgi:hypothetical protein
MFGIFDIRVTRCTTLRKKERKKEPPPGVEYDSKMQKKCILFFGSSKFDLAKLRWWVRLSSGQRRRPHPPTLEYLWDNVAILWGIGGYN